MKNSVLIHGEKKFQIRKSPWAGLPVFLSLLLSVLLSCQTISSIIQEPKVSVSSVDLDKINFNGIDMICRLNVENPNGFDIPFPEIDWQLYINANSFINGILKNDTRLKGNGTVTVDVPFSVTYTGLYNTFTSLLDSKEAAYQIALGLKFPLPLLDDKTYNLDWSGVIPLLQIPKIQNASYKTGRIDFSGVEQEWEFTVENPNVFPVPFPQLDWEYAVNDVPVLKSSVSGNGEIAALSNTPITVKTGVTYADLLEMLGSLGGSSQLQSLMNLNTSFPIPALENFSDVMKIPGTFPVFHKPELSFRGINIKNLALQRLEFVATWEIENKNDFALDIGNFNYNLLVNNSLWAQGTMDIPPQVKANSVTVIPLDITISSVALITQIIDIINRGSGVNFSSTGNFNFSGDLPGLDMLDLPFDLSGITRLIRL